MKWLLFVMLLATNAFGQMAPQPQPTLAASDGGIWTLDWESVSGRTYFIQYSEDLQTWHYFPEIVSGDGTAISYGFSSTTDKFFVRLKYTDVATTDPEGDDFDGDGLSNIDELEQYGLDPLNGMTNGVVADAIAAIPGTWWNATGYPSPTDAATATPLAKIQSRTIEVNKGTFIFDFGIYNFLGVTRNGTDLVNDVFIDDDGADGEYGAVLAADGFHDVATATSALSFGGDDDNWVDGVRSFSTFYFQSSVPSGPPHEYRSAHQQYRLLLDAPAPDGGYTMKVRIGTPLTTRDPSFAFTTSSSGTPYIEITLTVPAGETKSAAVDVPITDVASTTGIVYVPADIQLHKASTPVEADGMCVRPGDGFIADFDGATGNSKFDTLLPDCIFKWEGRRVKIDGTFEAWTPLHSGSYHDVEQTMSIVDEGCYQLQLVIILPDSTRIELPYIKHRNNRSIVSSGSGTIISRMAALGRAGAPDYFGIAVDTEALAMRDRAVEWLGSTQYSYDGQMITDPNPPTGRWNPNTMKRSKCNIFVTHVANYIGHFTPYWVRNGIYSYAPLAREDWFNSPSANVNVTYYGWPEVVATRFPSPGMIVSSEGGGTGASSGHMGVLDYDGAWVNAGSSTVNKFLYLADPQPKYSPVHLRSDQ